MLRALLSLIFLTSGILHLLTPTPFISIMPPFLPNHAWLVAVSGMAEITGAIGLWFPTTRKAAGWGLILLLIAVFPANVEMLRQYRERGVVWWGEALLWLRLPLQILLIWAVWRASRRE